MSIKRSLKLLFLGRSGLRARKLRVGPLRGFFFRVDTDNQSQRLLGLAEREIVGPLKRIALRATTALDIGASDGWYSLYFASLPNIEKVYAFEPNPESVAELRRNFSLNDEALQAKLTVVASCVGDSESKDARRLDGLASEVSGPIAIKIDVDGAELEVLKGAAELLKATDFGAVVETHSEELERSCLEYFHALGCRTEIIDPGWYRALVPERRSLAHNRWLVAEKRDSRGPAEGA